ncbi:hypothetical protein PAXRUDRAFT_141563 [Paxillus rubicundulus Ve08.2h10]|uniref:Oxidoreductase AflY n=1 Tax=Paxillus rubicundulus Ve08.2h10 TaxID=930991 RepID=A0A0D0DQW4_9AGAM|nr:hypothetical protein PAXRUDRAFT_141563 [Paxillus rubicundulus Ve08.2h10]
MRLKLPTAIKPGLVNIPGCDPEAQGVAESLLEQDRQTHHCFFNSRRFHNHLSHHLLAAYDLGAPAPVLQAIYDTESAGQRQIGVDEPEDGTLDQVTITPDNLREHLGQERYYSALLAFFTEQIEELGVSETLERYVFSTTVNVKGFDMLSRFMSGAYHPWIQTGYGAEFSSDAMVAQGLAQASVHPPLISGLLYDFAGPGSAEDLLDASVRDEKSEVSAGRPLLHILRDVYDSKILHPVTPYNPVVPLSARQEAMMKDGRPEEIQKLCATWWGNKSPEGEATGLEQKIEELFWTTTLLLSGSGKRGRKPRLDFFLMHVLDATLFMPSLLKIVPNDASKVKLVKAFLPVALMFILVCGRPRIDPGLVMSFTATPRPPSVSPSTLTPSEGTIGDPNQSYNPWFEILQSVIHAPNAHTPKVIRSLYYAAQRYGRKKAGSVPGCFMDEGRQYESIPGISEVDGTVFVRAAGVVMDTLGWVTHGDEPGRWDHSGLGWEDAWKNED